LRRNANSPWGGSAYDLLDALYHVNGDELLLEQDYSRTR